MDDSLIGRDVGDGFVITKALGAGGMGAVYLAENDTLGKRIAFKVLLPRFAEHPVVVQRFIQEARAACETAHPNIIEILGNGRLDDGRHYFKMEFVAGRDLASYCQEFGPLPVDLALEILAQIAAALIEVHKRKIVHRDIKPQNVMIAPAAGNLVRVKVLDFGIAKLSDSEIVDSVRTAVPVPMGTPGYWSPEQARGDRVDHRADIYAVGVMAYQMLTGVMPDGMQPMDPRTHRPDLPAGWAEAILWALGFDPAQRAPTMRAFIQALIDATEDGARLAAKAAPSLYESADAYDATMKHHADIPLVGAARTPPPASAWSTPGYAAGQAGDARSQSRPRVWAAALVIGALGVTGALLALRAGSNDGGNDSAAGKRQEAAEAQHLPAEPDASVVRHVPLTVRSDPGGALVFVDDEPEPRGAAPLTIHAESGSELRLRGVLPGHIDARAAFTVPAAEQSVSLLLVQAAPPEPKRAAQRPRRPTAETRERAPKSADDPQERKRAPDLFPSEGLGGIR